MEFNQTNNNHGDVHNDLHCGTESKILIIDYGFCKLCGKGLMTNDHSPYCSEFCEQVAAREG